MIDGMSQTRLFQTPPNCESEMIAFVRDMSDGYKKTSHLKEAIRRSWVPGAPDHRCPESPNANTVLHVAARMGEAKVGQFIGV